MDTLLDLLAAEILFKSHLRQRNYLVVPGKAQPDQLILAQAVDLRVPFRRRQRLQAQPLLQPDNAILDLDWVFADLEENDDRRGRQNHKPTAAPAHMAHQVNNAIDQVKQDNEGQNHVKGGVKPCVIFETLRDGLTHAMSRPLLSRSQRQGRGRHRYSRPLRRCPDSERRG